MISSFYILRHCVCAKCLFNTVLQKSRAWSVIASTFARGSGYVQVKKLRKRTTCLRSDLNQAHINLAHLYTYILLEVPLIQIMGFKGEMPTKGATNLANWLTMPLQLIAYMTTPQRSLNFFWVFFFGIGLGG